MYMYSRYLALASLVATTAVPRLPGQGLPASSGLIDCEKSRRNILQPRIAAVKAWTC